MGQVLKDIFFNISPFSKIYILSSDSLEKKSDLLTDLITPS